MVAVGRALAGALVELAPAARAVVKQERAAGAREGVGGVVWAVGGVGGGTTSEAAVRATEAWMRGAA